MKLFLAGGDVPIKKPWMEFNAANLASAPEKEGVYEIGDGGQNIIYIHGSDNLRRDLLSHLQEGDTPIEQARFFRQEEAFMFTSRENEHLRLYMRTSNQLPVCNQELI